MGKTKSNLRGFIKIKIKLFSSLLIFLLLILNACIIFLLLNLNYLKAYEIAIHEQLLSNIEDTHGKKLQELSTLEVKIEDLKGLDQKILTIKQQFFDNALAYETLVLQGKGTKKIAYLTIDDGPYSQYTPSFLDILDNYDILATFFLIGKPNPILEPIYKRIADSGHTIGNHTYSHAIKRGLYNSVDSFINDVIKQEKFLQTKTGVTTNIVRFPGGSMTAKSGYRTEILKRLRTLNYGYIDWNVSTGDSGGYPTPTSVLNNVLNGINDKKIAVILMHDFSYSTLLALPTMIEELKRRDYIFLPLFYESAKIIK
ncbi:MAG: polysaccharide deacetylase family protein [Bacilli bacterium]|jgi:peptidoglycan/xylan/chitin deacetylase (PgdA/CDA1 family)